MKNLVGLLLLMYLLPNCLFSQNSFSKLEKTTTFFPGNEDLKKENIEWSYLKVPENWEKPEGRTIKIAVAVLKSFSKNISNPNPVIYIEGGPGAGGTESIGNWVKHPLRENSDIVFVDVRGTGNSLPKFCPELGEKFLEILAKNQSSTLDEQQKTIAAMSCRQDLLNQNIDLSTYNSTSIAKDLNALKIALKYTSWNVYGLSYGTYTAQVYASLFPQDIKSLILDSSISDIYQYYNHNTSNYMSSLKKVFDQCKNDPNCNQQYPNLEDTYFKIIEDLTKKPFTVNVKKKIIPTGKFTYNAEDFKIAIQQSLYRKKLIEVLPLLITEFDKRNSNTLSALVASFAGSLGLDYGVYYCMSCNEAVPNNSISEFNKDALKYPKLKGGLSFYKSDFFVCDKWNSGLKRSQALNDLSALPDLQAQVLVFSGEFDPITPNSNGKSIVEKFKNGFLVNAPVFGHCPSLSKIGSKILTDFINDPKKQPNVKEFEVKDKVRFITNITVSGGVSNFANSLNEFDLLFFLPLFLAAAILLISVLVFVYKIFKNEKVSLYNKVLRYLIIITSLLGLILIFGFVVAINTTVQDNFYILAFGLPASFNFLFVIQWVFIALTIISIVFFAFTIKLLSNVSIMGTILFSLFVICVYFYYWGFFA
ncbi:alpha/beta fold hydrolase [[Flexibacter] sp. ATCC 35103]|uniref:alpha/beta fold hydrolase n=1 Tax=[Flexibacter] sp. ATCC 35103 TaxID=1937528 RepID=UPI0009C1F179|nr:alpha/beta fold hydrolase [[Flexibacter] sp. ATCC 35103]AQX14475.1 alpha/beta-hydrolase-like domain protein [[Flexibacter] sp. ATCC 35103]OMQ08258.1 alpha/beta hydrolase [[Flexibacter] sp. ATCC 35103]